MRSERDRLLEYTKTRKPRSTPRSHNCGQGAGVGSRDMRGKLARLSGRASDVHTHQTRLNLQADVKTRAPTVRRFLQNQHSSASLPVFRPQAPHLVPSHELEPHLGHFIGESEPVGALSVAGGVPSTHEPSVLWSGDMCRTSAPRCAGLPDTGLGASREVINHRLFGRLRGPLGLRIKSLPGQPIRCHLIPVLSAAAVEDFNAACFAADTAGTCGPPPPVGCCTKDAQCGAGAVCT